MKTRPPRRLRWRIIIPAAACLVLGLLTTTLYAWYLSAITPPSPDKPWRSVARERDPARGEGVGSLFGYCYESPGWGWDGKAWWGRWEIGRGAIAEYAGAAGPRLFGPNKPTPEEFVPRRFHRLALPWVTGDEPWPTDPEMWETRKVYAFGWPRLAWAWYESGRAPAGSLKPSPRTPHGFLRIPGLPMKSPGKAGAAGNFVHDKAPIIPLWRGLAIDTAALAAAWAGVLALAFYIPRALIRRVVVRRRRRRGWCPRCAYDLKGEMGKGCPECGWGRSGAPDLRGSNGGASKSGYPAESAGGARDA